MVRVAAQAPAEVAQAQGLVVGQRAPLAAIKLNRTIRSRLDDEVLRAPRC